jgi:hypothetical protein
MEGASGALGRLGKRELNADNLSVEIERRSILDRITTRRHPEELGRLWLGRLLEISWLTR